MDLSAWFAYQQSTNCPTRDTNAAQHFDFLPNVSLNVDRDLLRTFNNNSTDRLTTGDDCVDWRPVTNSAVRLQAVGTRVFSR